MHTRSRRRPSIPFWSVAVSGFANEPVTQWQPPTAESPPVSSRVRLEVQILSTDPVAPVPVLARTQVRLRHTVLLVSHESAVRRDLYASLSEHPKLRLLEACSPTAAASLASEVAVHLIIADAMAASVMQALPEVRTILLADNSVEMHLSVNRLRQHVMQRPFSAETLSATVLLLLEQ